jgi:hypothetical protein
MAKKTFKVIVNDKEVEVAVKSPNAQQKKQGNIIYLRSCRNYMEGGLYTRATLDKYMREEGCWDDEKQAEHDRLQKILIDGERRLAQGGIKLSDGRQIAVDMVQARRDLTDLLIERNNYDNLTAEGYATNDKFNYLVSVCTVYNDTGKPVFSSLENYEERIEEPIAVMAATSLAELIYNLDEDFSANLPETKFLKKFKFVNDELRFIDKEGRYVNMNGELINEEGFRVDQDGKILGQEEEESQSVPFLDDEGNPIVDNG